MELALNILWFLLVLGGLCYWLGRKPDISLGAHRSLAWRRGLVSLCCALVVLFPVISMTDDLHDEVAVLEKSKPSGKELKGGNDDRANSGLDQHQATAATGAENSLSSFHGQHLGWIVSRNVAMRKTIFARVSPGRAPPHFYR